MSFFFDRGHDYCARKEIFRGCRMKSEGRGRVERLTGRAILERVGGLISQTAMGIRCAFAIPYRSVSAWILPVLGCREIPAMPVHIEIKLCQCTFEIPCMSVLVRCTLDCVGISIVWRCIPYRSFWAFNLVIFYARGRQHIPPFGGGVS